MIPGKALAAAALALPLLANAPAAQAQITTQSVNAGGVDAALIKPARPRASIILMSGGDGYIGIGADGSISRGAGNQLVRTRDDYAAQGFAVLVPNNGVNLAQALAYMAAIKKPVTVVATSRGTLRAAEGIAAGARPDRLVLTAGILSDKSSDGDETSVADILGSPAALPPTLVVHHRQDGCRVTVPSGVQPFVDWAKGRARVVWLEGGKTEGNPCQARGYHGFNGIDGKVVSVVSAFAR